MSVQGDLESAILLFVGLAIPGITAIQGPSTLPNVEGSTRAVSVRKTAGAATRLEFAQTLWAETFALTCYWAATIPRETVLVEWESVRDALQDDPELGVSGTHRGLERSWLATETWGEAMDGHFRIMAASMVVERVE